MRASVLFAVLASAVLCYANPNATLPPIPADLSTPVQVRLAFHGPTGMAIGWNTFQALSKPRVRYGLDPHLLFFSAESTSSVTYPTSRTWANTVIVKGLIPSTKYYYKIDSTNSTTSSFTTGKLAGDPRPFTAALVVDMGVFGPDGLSTRTQSYSGVKITDSLQPGEQTTIQSLVQTASTYDFVIHPGDHAYADTGLKELLISYVNATAKDDPLVYEGLNEQYWQQLSAVSSIKPYMVGAGNHEANCDNGGTKNFTEQNLCIPGQTNFTGYINRFGLVLPDAPQTPLGRRSGILPPHELGVFPRKRNNAPAPLPPFWYSFDHGMAHFIVYNTETDFATGLLAPDQAGGSQNDVDGPFGSANQQVDWIKQDLASVNRFLTPWVIAAGHRPWYVASSDPCYVCQENFEKLFVDGGVDLVVSGHVHNMERQVPIAYNVTDPAGLNNPKAPWYIVNGAAGHFEGLDNLTLPLPNYTAFANDTLYGYTRLNFLDRNHLRADMVSSASGQVIDSATLFKKH